MSEATDVLLGLIEQENARVIHYQEERANTTNIIFVLAGAMIALISFDGRIGGPIDIFLASLLFLLGLLGMLLNAKYHERIYYHESRGKGFYTKLDQIMPDASIGKILKRVSDRFDGKILLDDDQEQKESGLTIFLHKRNLWRTWISVNAITSIVGVILLVAAIMDP